MTCEKPVEILQVEAYKIFIRNEHEELQTAFAGAFKHDLVYAPNKRIQVDDEKACFFAFKNFQHALSIVSSGIRTWRFVSDRLMVLPVTLFHVVTEGKFHVPSDDPQCMDGYYPAFESKEIKVHDNTSARSTFFDEVIVKYFKHVRMSKIEREAFNRRLPEIFGARG